MMDLLYRSTPPGYKGKGKGNAKLPTQHGAGFLSGLWCYLFGGGGSPGYRTKETNGATAPVVSRCWWGLTAAPQYKAPPDQASDPDPEGPPCGGQPTDEDCSCEPDVEPREIHIYPGG